MRALKLNLGCGHDKRSGYVNVDVDPRLKPDVVHDLLKPLPFEDDSVSEMLLQDVLEHVTREQALKLLQECSRVLKKSGKLLVRVPNVMAILEKYRSQPDLLMLFLYGDTTISGTWGAHKYGYTPTVLAEMVQSLGLTIISHQMVDTNYEFELVKKKKHLEEVLCYQLGEFVSKTLTTDKTNKKLIWVIQKRYPSLLSKLLLRPLSKMVDEVWVTDGDLIQWVKEQLRFSHLRIKNMAKLSQR